MSGSLRRDNLRQLLRENEVEAILVTNFTNVSYLTGFTGDDSYLLVTDQSQALLSDPRYTTQLEQECPGLPLEIRQPGTTMGSWTAEVVGRHSLSRLAVEADTMTVGQFQAMQEKLAGVELKPVSGLVEKLRLIKDDQEVAAIREAARIAERAFDVLRATLRAGQTEREVAHDLEHQIRLFGGSGCSFPPIVAVGPQAALPHARPTDIRIGSSEFVLIDWGARAAQYVSDLTRVLVTGKIPPKLETIYEVVLNAQQQAIAAIRPGAVLQEIDAVARDIITEAGYGPQFGHGLGHGIGLEVHEAPRLAKNQPQTLQTGMVVTVEPGIYLPGWGGVRIEDDVLVTSTGYEVLTSAPKQFADCVATI
ncbi:MAG: Xaa-Pro peptidase family protein [Pirellulaceae bacterium]